MRRIAQTGNDTIDPYPLIPVGAKKILIVKRDIFEELAQRYKSFFTSLRGRLTKRSKALKKPISRIKTALPEKNHFRAYEPSSAIVTNECDYRRWCRVSEWFAEFGSDAEKFERTILIQ